MILYKLISASIGSFPVFVVTIKITILANPRQAKPEAIGIKVSSYSCPIKTPSPAEISVEKVPTTAAPIPAIFPKGSMAMALRLPKRIAIHIKLAAKNNINAQKGGTPPEFKATRKKPPEQADNIAKVVKANGL